MNTGRVDRFALAGMFICAAAAAVASASALASLAATTGWSGWSAWLLPLAIDCLAAVAVRVWLDTSAPAPARRYGRTVAIGAVFASMAGNAASHLHTAGDLAASWPLIVIVGATPAAALAAVAHLHALRTAPVPSRRRSRTAPSATRAADGPTDQSATAAASSANTVREPSANPRPRTTAAKATNTPANESATTSRVTADEYADRAVAAWRPGIDVTAGWVQSATGCGKTTAHKITPAVRERVAARAGVVVELAREEQTA